MGKLSRLFGRKNSDAASSTPSPTSSAESPTLSPVSRRSWKSSKSPKSPTSTPISPLLRTHQNIYGLEQCEGCNIVEGFIRRNVEKRPGRPQSVTLHTSYHELHECAQRCQICRIFRQALVLEKVTFDDVKQVEDAKGEIIIRWGEKTLGPDSATTSFMTVEIKGKPDSVAMVNCNSHNDVSHLALKSDGFSPAVTQQAKAWLDTCVNTHIGDCDNLAWSNENPRLLVEILSDQQVQLREDQQGQYVALSYCWGNPKVLSPTQLNEIERGKTVTKNLSRRLQPFDIGELPTTVQDALRFLHAMEVRYAWIDTMCIVQDNPVGVTTMHKVYSNALFTLCSCATTQATAKMLDHREAWSQSTEPCRLGGQWLTTPDMSLTELRLRSPLAERAWTLQEERLSPRMLYVSSSRVYWSCVKSHEMEMHPLQGHRTISSRRPIYSVDDRDTEMPIAQEFLRASYMGTMDLHTFWADIVKSYAMRNMTNLSDRLTALSGLAARYLSASKGDEYLAGLWAHDLSEGLAWRVDKATEVTQSDADWPSWSWAKLPLQTELHMDAESPRSSAFHRKADDDSKSKSEKIPADQAITRGQNIKEIRVTGHNRKLWGPSSRKIEWSSVSRFVEGVEKFSFAADRQQDAHAVHPESGRILIYEDQKREIIGQLDFRRDVKRALSDQVDWWALELGVSTMLLLEPCGKGRWRRVGVAWDVREAYFTDPSTDDLILQ